ncbi:MKRN2 opposite strand, tandem duplicate 1 [Clupea harengus]|uniref:MKRN2 opposite strand, tandem duplicate 1 n=1 Tax=Clupea harengus TaxID=7950 RepID=A0A8M1KIE1_CLUHA|nr:MKRN2 opposite strand, tandem duplicate 1 [Clupea harengus]
MDRTIIKFNHCQKDIYRFTGLPSFANVDLEVPRENEFKQCPICFETLTFDLLNAPVSIPSPFANGHKVPCAFTIGSVHGPSFLGEWHDSELHVGVTNSTGVVYNYTLSGLRRDDHGWEKCVSLQLVPPWRVNLKHSWDGELEQFCSLSTWTPERFHEEREFGSRCYGFALAFINHIHSLEGKTSLSRDEFTGTHILPRVKTVSKYIRVYQEISQNGFYIADQIENVNLKTDS